MVYAYRAVRFLPRAGGERAVDDREEDEGVSVIITAHNRAGRLRENLIGFLMQDYNKEKYEVIVVDDCSEDDTTDMLARLQEEYPWLRHTRVYPNTKFRFTKKLAMNIGILSARHDALLFSEADCYPSSTAWARTMRSCFDSETAVVTGFSNFREGREAFSWRRYFRFARFLEMLRLTGEGMYLMGDGCNMGCRKSRYMRNKGFAGDTQAYLGHDHGMTRALARHGKVRACTCPESFMLVDEERERVVDDVSRYFADKARWPARARLRASASGWARTAVYLTALALALTGWPRVAMGLAGAAYALDATATAILARRFKQGGLLPAMLLARLAGFAYRWYWQGYSFFNPRKWR
ncbi:MAG: glycosyltransferase [Odoribacteraceae bacterium]|nr:glycosyltransferase [Odoribacteraceae bacterium]